MEEEGEEEKKRVRLRGRRQAGGNLRQESKWREGTHRILGLEKERLFEQGEREGGMGRGDAQTLGFLIEREKNYSKHIVPSQRQWKSLRVYSEVVGEKGG